MTPSREYYEWEYRGRFDSEYQTQSQIEGGGSVDLTRFELEGGWGGPMFQKVRLSMDVGYAHTDYEFGNVTAAECPDPAKCFGPSAWNDIHTIDVAPGASFVFNESVRVQAYVPIRWHMESDSDRSGFTGGLVTTIGFKLAERFWTEIGVGIQSEIEASLSVFPVITLNWIFNDRFSFVTRGGPYQGGEAALLWKWNDAVDGSISAGYERRRFRLEPASPNVNGVGEFTSIPLLVGLSLKIDKNSFISIQGGVAVDSKLRSYDRNGNFLAESDVDTAGMIRGAIRVEF